MNGFSIIICTYNGRSRLERTLQHLALLEVSVGYFVELIIVDNASTDNTSSFATETWEVLGAPFSLRIISERRPGKAYAIETGYDAAAFDFIVTVDDDNWLQADYLLQAAEIIRLHPNIGLIGGYSIGQFEAPKSAWLDEIPEAFAVGRQAKANGIIESNRPLYLWGAGLVVNTAFWRSIREQGFTFMTGLNKGKAVGEDSELCIVFQFLGYDFYYSDSLVIHHWMPPARMEEGFCIKMFRGFGKTGVYFDLYNILAYKIKSRRRIIPFIIYGNLLKAKVLQLQDHHRKKRSGAAKYPIIDSLKFERAKTEMKELIRLLPRFSSTIKLMKRNLGVKPLKEKE